MLIKTLKVQNYKRLLKAARKSGQVTYKGRTIRITPGFPTETIKATRAWTDVLKTQMS